MNDLVSVIVPAYNIATYIERCVQSILNQTHKNIEILVVDDGSTDSTLEICQRLERDDSRVRVFHKENGGVSTARNLALDYCKGEYISIIDGDDWIEPTLYADAICAMQETEAEVFMFEYFIDADGKSKVHCVEDSFYGRIEKREAIIHSITPHNRFVWTKVFSSKLLLDRDNSNQIRFDTSIILGEDTLFIEEVLLGAKGVFYSHKPYYHYEQREGSAVRSRFNSKKMSGLKAYSQVREMLKNSDLGDVCIYVDEALFNLGMSLASEVVQESNHKKYIVDIKKYIAPIRLRLLASRCVAIKTKIKVVMSMLSLKMAGKVLAHR